MCKINGKEHDEQFHNESNNKCKVCVHQWKTENLSKYCYGLIGTFTKGALRITNNNKEFYGSELTEREGKILSEEVIQYIKNN